MVYTLDLKSSAERIVGSSPTRGTKHKKYLCFNNFAGCRPPGLAQSVTSGCGLLPLVYLNECMREVAATKKFWTPQTIPQRNLLFSKVRSFFIRKPLMTNSTQLKEVTAPSKIKPARIPTSTYNKKFITQLLEKAYEEDKKLFCNKGTSHPIGQVPYTPKPSLIYSCPLHGQDHVLTRASYGKITNRRKAISNIQKIANQVGGSPQTFLRIDANLFSQNFSKVKKRNTPVLYNRSKELLPDFLVAENVQHVEDINGAYFYSFYKKLVKDEASVFCEKGIHFDKDEAPKDYAGHVYMFCDIHNNVHYLDSSVYRAHNYTKIASGKIKSAFKSYKTLSSGQQENYILMSETARLDLTERQYNNTPSDPNKAAVLRSKRERVLRMPLPRYKCETGLQSVISTPGYTSRQSYPVDEKLSSKLPKRVPNLTVKSLTAFFTKIVKVDSKMFCSYGMNYEYGNPPQHLVGGLAFDCRACNKTHVLGQDDYLSSSQLMAYRQVVIQTYKKIPKADKVIQLVATEVSHSYFPPISPRLRNSKATRRRKELLNVLANSKNTKEFKERVKELKKNKELSKEKISDQLIKKESFLHIDASQVDPNIVLRFQECLRKTGYSNPEDAQRMIERNHPNTDKHPYLCPHCAKYHYGSTNPNFTLEEKLETASRNWNDERFAYAVHQTILSLGLMEEK